MKFGCLRFIFFFLQCVVKMDGTHIKAIDSVGDPPLPIPNREVKPDSADGTANVCGRVGHRHFYRKDEFQKDSSFCIYRYQCPSLLVVPSFRNPHGHELRPCFVRPIAAGTNELHFVPFVGE